MFTLQVIGKVTKVSKRAKARNVRFEAAQLLGKWTRLARGHVVMGGNCSCGLGGASVRVEEFEQQILDYLDSAFGRGGDATIGRTIREAGNVSALLRSITVGAQPQSAEWLSVLDALDRTIESFEQVHS